MILWLLLTAMTSIAAVFVAAPFLRDWEARPDPRERDMEQLREIEEHGDRDAAPRRGNGSALLSAKERALAAIGVAGVVALGSVGLFAVTAGQAPLARSEAEAPAISREARTPPVEEMIGRLARRLQDEPNDVTGWRTLGWARLQTDSYAEAAAAYAKAIELQPRAADNYSARAEALIRASRDEVTAEAQAALDAALARDPKDARARYWQGVAKKQRGDESGAREIWRGLLTEGAEGDFASEINRQIAALEGGTAPQAQMDETAMIHAMVDGLEQRLSNSPSDAQGWIRLIKSRMVLGEIEKARAALERALNSFSGDVETRQRIGEAAKEAGL
jgi:cytochrome c-type biogenesis protein CcmH